MLLSAQPAPMRRTGWFSALPAVTLAVIVRLFWIESVSNIELGIGSNVFEIVGVDLWGLSRFSGSR